MSIISSLQSNTCLLYFAYIKDMKVKLLKNNRYYLCIDQKSFYASVECSVRGLDPMTTNLVVADPERGKGTLCLAVSPSMKKLGVKNRARVYEIPDNIQYIMAPPRMQLYIDYSAKIYGVFLKYIAKEDIHVYSIDESFLDVTDYMDMYNMNAVEIAKMILKDINETLGLVGTVGIGTNLYLSKIALDITAKHAADRIGYLDVELYKHTLWDHQPLTDFWRIGPGTAKRLFKYGIKTMGEIAKADPQFLYKLFGVDAEYLIDHAWGMEPVTIAEIKSYKSISHSVSSSQVLLRDYNYEEAFLIVKEMAELISLDLVDRGVVTNSITLSIGYSGNMHTPSSGSSKLSITTNSARKLSESFQSLFIKVVDQNYFIRNVALSCNDVIEEAYEQYDLFTSPIELERERKIQTAVLNIKKRYGKNSILKGMNLLESGTTIIRNEQIGGHKRGVS